MPAMSTSAHCTMTRVSKTRAPAGVVSLNRGMHRVPRERVDFEIDAIARGAAAERRAADRLGNERDFKPVLARSRDRDAHAVDTDEGLLANVTLQIARERDAHAFALPFARA